MIVRPDPATSNGPGAHQSHNCCGIIWLNYFYYKGTETLRKEIREAVRVSADKAMILAALSSPQVPFMHDTFIEEGFAPVASGNNQQAPRGPDRPGVSNNITLYAKIMNQPRDIPEEERKRDIEAFGAYWQGDRPARTRAFG